MSLTAAKALLVSSQNWPRDEVLARLSELNDAFRTFWDSEPSEDEFSATMAHVTLTARMLYIMAWTRVNA